MTKLYIDSIGIRRKEEVQALTLMRLYVKDACRKKDLEKIIQKETEALQREYPEPPRDSSKYNQWEDNYQKAYWERVSPLNTQFNAIRGPLEWYIVPLQVSYEIGQILNEL